MAWSKFKSTWVNGNLEFDLEDGHTSADYILDDNIKLTFGTGSDAKLYWNGSELQGPNPATGMWANCPALAYSDISDYYQWTEDFMQLAIDNTTGYPVAYTTTSDTAASPVTLVTGQYGGVVRLLTGATDNNQTSIQAGSGAVGTTVEITDASGYELWYECRISPSIATECAIFIGLAEEASTDIILDGGAASFSNTDCIGFSTNTDTGLDEWDFQYHLAGYVRYTDAAVADNSALTSTEDWHTFGFHFGGASVLTPYVDGVAQTAVDTSAASFPSGEEMSPIVAVKTGTTATKGVYVDWIRIVGQR